MMLSSHLCLGLPLGLVVKGFHLNIFLAALVSDILCTWPNQLSLWARGRKPRKQITWSSSLGVRRRAIYPSMENSSCQTPKSVHRSPSPVMDQTYEQCTSNFRTIPTIEQFS